MAPILSRMLNGLKRLHFENDLQSSFIYQYTIRVRTMAITTLPKLDTPLIAIAEAKRFMKECMEAVGTPTPHAEALANLLAEADYRGHYSHGMNRLEMYVKDVKTGTCNGCAIPKILKETPATAWVDGLAGLGAVVGNFCMDLAIKKAKCTGVGVVSAKGSNHYGIAGIYALQAIKQGLIGFTCTNTSPFMCPTRAKQAALGTNPLSLGAPAACGDSFVLDMATTAVAVGKIEIQKRKKEPIPEGWALNKEGQITTNAEEAYAAALLMPLGGAEINSGYKGFGLGLMVEVLSGILAGAKFGPNIRKWGDNNQQANLGQCFIAIDPECFAPRFKHRLCDLLDSIRKLERVDPCNPIMVAGDPEKSHMAAVDKAGGVQYVQNQLDTCEKLSKTLKVCPLKPLCQSKL